MTEGNWVTPNQIRQWGRRAHGSPLYHSLATFIADDPELMKVIEKIVHRPQPNLLFGAVQFLLMRGEGGALTEHYASLVDDPRSPEGAGPVFKEFVLEHEQWIVETANTRYTQTNEVKRCAALLPAVWGTGLERFHLIEIGASAGLNLAMDLYRYRWSDVEWGPDDSSVLLDAPARGGRVEPRGFHAITRTGLDLNPIDVGDEDERDWLLALIWPEHHDRRTRLMQAFEVASTVPIEMVPGDASETLVDVVASLPGDEPVIVMNSMVLIQFTRSQREALYRAVEESGRDRVVRRASFEFLAAGDDWVTISADQGRGLAQIGRAHPHGEWIELYARP